MGKRTARIGTLWAGTALTVGGLVAAGLPLHAGADAAAGGVVVVHGTSFPDPSRTGLTLVGCDDLYQVAPEVPQPMIGQGPGDAPIGDRSLAYDLAGGNALGAVFRVSSVVSTTTASLAVHPWEVAATGVGYVAYQAPDDADTGQFWLGRTSLSAPGAVWTTIDVTGRAYEWTHYDQATHAPIAPGSDQAETVADFAAQHGGDGPGVYTVGFGCNGTPFNLDDLRLSGATGSTTYDLEGLTTQVAMAHRPAPDGAVDLRGTLTSGSGDALPDATLLLEQSNAADGPWRPVGAVAVHNGVATTTVSPTEKMWYRWRFVDRPLAAGSVSQAYAVVGTDADPTDPPTTGPSSHPSSHPTPTVSTSGSPSETPSETPSESASGSPSESPSQSASPTSSDSPSQSPSSDQPSGDAGSSSSTPSPRAASASASDSSTSGG